MFVAFVGSTYTRIYIPTNVYKAYVKSYKSYPELAANEISEAIFLFAVLHSKTQHVLGGLLGKDLL